MTNDSYKTRQRKSFKYREGSSVIQWVGSRLEVNEQYKALRRYCSRNLKHRFDFSANQRSMLGHRRPEFSGTPKRENRTLVHG